MPNVLNVTPVPDAAMDVAGDAQSLAAAGNHAALNLANALGAFLGGLVIAAGLGYTAPAFVGAGLAAVLWCNCTLALKGLPSSSA